MRFKSASHLKTEHPALRRFVKEALLFGVLHYIALLCLAGIVFLLSHVPPKAVNLDALILRLVDVEDVLTAPRRLVLGLWPWQFTPRGARLFLVVFNSAVWGVCLAAARTAWRRVIR